MQDAVDYVDITIHCNMQNNSVTLYMYLCQQATYLCHHTIYLCQCARRLG